MERLIYLIEKLLHLLGRHLYLISFSDFMRCKLVTALKGASCLPTLSVSLQHSGVTGGRPTLMCPPVEYSVFPTLLYFYFILNLLHTLK